MYLLNRFRSTLLYLKDAGRITRWRLLKAPCPACSGATFLSLGANDYLTRCLCCRANLTNLSLIPVIKAHAAQHPVEVAWEMSTYGATLDYLQRTVPTVYTSEYFAGIASGKLVNGIRCEDVQATSFADGSLDLITSNQVFEHVPDDVQGFRECCRILRPGGALVFSVPLHNIAHTRLLARLNGGSVELLQEPEYHHSRIGGPNAALCFWHHSLHDIVERVAQVGFRVELVKMDLCNGAVAPSWVVLAVKPHLAV